MYARSCSLLPPALSDARGPSSCTGEDRSVAIPSCTSLFLHMQQPPLAFLLPLMPLRLPNAAAAATAAPAAPAPAIALSLSCGASLTAAAGDAKSDGVEDTVEKRLFHALDTTKLVETITTGDNYSRCGRTDRGVSALGNVSVTGGRG